MGHGDGEGELAFFKRSLVSDQVLANLELFMSALAIVLIGLALVSQEDAPALAVEEWDLELVF